MTAITSPELDGVHNFRVLGSYPLKGGGSIRPGMIYRAGALDMMTDSDRAYLAGECGIAMVLDLRHPDEFAGSEVAHGLADRVSLLSLFPETLSQEGLIAELNGLYGTGPSPERYLHYLTLDSARFVQAFALLARGESYPVLVHCTAGKDRTGVVLGMLMELLGAYDEDIAAEYALSDASLDRLIAYLEASGRVLEGTREEIRDRLATPPERMAGFITLLRERYGGAEAYLRDEGLPEEAVANMRDLLISR